MMPCPACGAATMAVEFEAIEVDYCAACGGLWFDRGELDLVLAGDGPPAAGWVAGPGVPGPRRCPHCRRHLNRGCISGTAIEVDVCPHQHGIWLDRGELQAVAERACPPEQGRRLVAWCDALLGKGGT